ncbi:PQQ-binding-like beta-propeller repeat protein [Streptomyces sp. NPDC006879]|uniref:protein kinase domain-containing protein n=1 Tax=Streptomyces sp. NPDC006879 TaxID=3364767 RepID=UPI00369C0803
MPSQRADQPQYAGQYRLERVLGSGGMGVVHLATSASGLRLAVKVVHAEHATDPEFRARFRQEVAAARRVSGAFTAPVVDADPEAPRPWMATSFIDAPTLAQRVREHPLDEAELGRLGAGLAEALRDIHRVGVVHRDLKPGNVLMAADGPRVIDFGISRPSDSDLRTETGKLIGTPPFMAPEQFQRPREVGPGADVFAMGAVLVHAATGRGPFDSDSPYIVAYQVVHQEPDLAGVPPRLAPLIARCLAKDPGERPTAAELVAELRSAAYRTAEDTRSFCAPVGADTPSGAAFPHPPEVSSGRDDEPTHLKVPAVPLAPAAARRRRRRPLTLALVGALLAGGAVAGGYRLAAEERLGTAAAARPKSAPEPTEQHTPWSVPGPAGAGLENRTAVCGYAAGDEPALYCKAPGVAAARLDPADGSERWRVPAPGAPSTVEEAGAPVLAGGLVHTRSTADGVWRALDPDTGEQRWQHAVSAYRSTLTVDDAVLLVGADGRVTALDAETGERRWTRRVGGTEAVWTAGPDGRAYASTAAPGGGSTQVTAVDTADGGIRWRVQVAGTPVPAVADERALYLLGSDERSMNDAVLRIDARTSKVRRVPLSAPMDQAQAAVGTDGTVYVVGAGGALAAVGDALETWRLETGVSRSSRPVVVGSRVLLMAADGRLLAVDSTPGAGVLVGQTPPRMDGGRRTYAPVLPAPVVGGPMVFGAAPDGSVFAVAVNGTAAW